VFEVHFKINNLILMDLSLVQKTSEFAKATLQGAEAGHDWAHTERVLRNARLILAGESADGEVVELAALLHDIADAKFHNGDEEMGPRLAGEFLKFQGLDEARTAHVCNIIRHMSFKGGNENSAWTSLEMEIVQDADRLDAIGAIGIARAFNYGGFKNRSLYNPEITPNLTMSKEAYRKSDAPTLNHFYEKLFLLKDRMNTSTGKKMALDRHQFMEEFVNRFLAEWEGRTWEELIVD
jgi:uncharacterized protein